MKTFKFTLVATGPLDKNSSYEDALFEAGCDDATVSFQKGVLILEFDRVEKNLSHAINSAVANVVSAGCQVVRIEPDHLVSMSEIAERVGITRAAVSLYAKGDRGDNFPAPAARVTSESPLWDWVDVSRWFVRAGKLSKSALVDARLTREWNLKIRSGHRLRA